jgi:hypothetical protein
VQGAKPPLGVQGAKPPPGCRGSAPLVPNREPSLTERLVAPPEGLTKHITTII